MELILIELLLWAGLIFFFWALRDGLNHIESELESQDPNVGRPASRSAGTRFDSADRLSEPIGRYCDAPIYRFAVIEGVAYQFKHILPPELLLSVPGEERCLSPGLVYAKCDGTGQP